MSRRPPAERINGVAHKLQHYIGRVQARQGLTLCMQIWPWNWQRIKPRHDGYFSNVRPTGKAITVEGAVHSGAPVEIWTWEEGPKRRERVHIRSLWVRSEGAK